MPKKHSGDVLDEATDLAIDELYRRLKDQPDLFGDSALQKMVETLDRRAERKAKEQAADAAEDSEPFALLDVLETFPLRRAHKLAVAERDRFLDEARALDEWMAANPVAVPGVSDLEPGQESPEEG